MAANNKFEQFSQWIIDLMDDKCSEEDFEQFQKVISTKPEYMRYYVEFVSMYSLLDRHNESYESTPNLSNRDTTIAMLELMAEKELEATPIKEVETEIIEPAKLARKTKVNKSKLNSYFFTIAAFVMICFGVLWLDKKIVNYHPPHILPKIAKINSHIDGDLRHKGEKLREGQWLWPGEYSLKMGFMELEFENGAKVVLESPVEFNLKSQDKMYLKFGRLYAKVPPQAVGFTVDSKCSKVVDLGTEFGMMVNVNGDTNLHVYKGQTALFSGNETGYNFEETIAKGNAKSIDSDSGKISNIALDNTAFARSINPKTKQIWFGAVNLNLADIVGGGNGFGTGQLDMGFDPATGAIETGVPEDRRVEGKYIPVDNKFVDGVFVPVGIGQQVSSTGIIFKECPQTNTNYYMNIVNGKGSTEWELSGIEESKLGDRAIGTPEYPSILMHANSGITFDLQAIQDELASSGLTFTGFKSDTGFASPGNLNDKGVADIYVLIDGEIKYSQIGMDDCETVYNIDIKITPSDRFLTLISSDGGDPDDGPISTWADWCVFAKPELILTTR